MRPAAGEIDVAGEGIDAVDLRWLGRRQATARHYVEATRHGRAIFRRQVPPFLALVPPSFRYLRREADIAAQVVAVGDEPQIGENFRLRGVLLRPRPRGFQIGIEGVAVV